MTVLKAQKKPIEAVILTESSKQDCITWINGLDPANDCREGNKGIVFFSPDGSRQAEFDDYIIKDHLNAFHVMKPEMFELEFEIVGAHNVG